MKNLLFVSISFPPKNDPECLQTARYFYYLQQRGDFLITVVTSKMPTLFMPQDDSLKRYMTGIHQLIEIPLFENKLLNFILRKTGLGSVMFPDSKMTFHWQWRSVVKQLKVKPDLIYSRSNPMSSAFMAMKLKEFFKCPWVMHMSDPWAISPLREHGVSKNARELKFENRLLSMADAVSFTTEQTLILYKKKYPWVAEKSSVFPNVFDPKDAEHRELDQSNKLRIVYTGGLAGKRNVFFLKQVLARIKEEYSEYEKEIEFIFAGDLDRFNRTLFDSPPATVSHIGLLSHARAKELCMTAHVLLLVDNPTSSEGAVFFPSKLLDYFLTKRKIWAVTPLGSATRSVLASYNHEAFEHDDIQGMSGFLMKCLQQRKNGRADYFVSENVPQQYSAGHNAQALANWLMTVK